MLIYLIENLINNKIYIGQTSQLLNKRIATHKYSIKNKSKNTYLLNAFRKYGFNNFKFSILDTASTIEELNKLEQWWIEIFNSTNREIGYNIDLGGKGKGIMAQETKDKISQNRSGKCLGKNNPNFGGLCNKGLKRTEDQKKNMSNSMTGIKKSDTTNMHNIKSIEHKKKLSEAAKNRKRKFTLEQKTMIKNEYNEGNSTYKLLSNKYNLSKSIIKEGAF